MWSFISSYVEHDNDGDIFTTTFIGKISLENTSKILQKYFFENTSDISFKT